MGDVGEYFRDWKEHKKEKRKRLGVECPQCKIARPRTNASILLPGQRCRVDGYRDPRPRDEEKSP